MRLLATALLTVVSLNAEVIDRIAATVGTSVITESELIRQIRLTAFFNNAQPDFSPDGKRAAADRLVEQALIRREITLARYAPTPERGPVKLNFSSEEEYRKALAESGLTDEEVRDHVRWQNTLLDFISERFRPGIQISDEEIRDYYESELVPQLKKNGNQSAPPPLEDVRAEIEQILIDQRANQALDRWLGQARTQTQIRYRQEVFQ